jgi:EmrB/QacA subfamily drug resistance transporter
MAISTSVRRPLLLPFAGLLLAMVIAALDQTITATALPTIAGELGGLSSLPWVVTAYVLAAAAVTPVWGKASDLYGRKDLLRGAIVLFVLASALSGISQSIGELIAFRAVQGIGAGGVMTLAMATVGDLVEPRERGRYQGYIQFVFVLASVAGPLLGGLFVDHLSWRWVFYVNLPVGAAALALLTRYLQVSAQRSPARIDFLGAGLLAAAFSAILLVTTWGGDRYAWGSTPIIGLGAAAVVLLAAFVVRERVASEPVLPLRLFRDPVFVVVSGALFITTLSLFAAIFFLPLFLQLVTGASATKSGLLVLPLLLASAVSTVVSGQIISRTGRYKVCPVIGLALMSVGLMLLSTLDVSSSRLTAALFMAVFGAASEWSPRSSWSPSRTLWSRGRSGPPRRRPTCSVRSGARSASRSMARCSPAGCVTGSRESCRAVCPPGSIRAGFKSAPAGSTRSRSASSTASRRQSPRRFMTYSSSPRRSRSPAFFSSSRYAKCRSAGATCPAARPRRQPLHPSPPKPPHRRSGNVNPNRSATAELLDPADRGLGAQPR